MRGVVESLRLVDLLRRSPVIAHPWLDGVKISDLKQPKGFKPATPVKEVMKLFDARSTGGSHAAFFARPLSALAEPEASKLLGDKRGLPVLFVELFPTSDWTGRFSRTKVGTGAGRTR